MTDHDLTETLELMLLARRVKDMLAAHGTQTQASYRTVPGGVQIWSTPQGEGFCAVYTVVTLPKGLREIPEYLVRLPFTKIMSEDLQAHEDIADHFLPEWARYILFVNFMRQDEPMTAENGEE